jgi:hypothetical protein
MTVDRGTVRRAIDLLPRDVIIVDGRSYRVMAKPRWSGCVLVEAAAVGVTGGGGAGMPWAYYAMRTFRFNMDDMVPLA